MFETWTMADPSKVKRRTLVWVPHIPYLTFASCCEGNVDQPQVIDIETKIIEFDPKSTDIIKLLCSSTGEDPYNFAILEDTSLVPFDPICLMQSLDSSHFDEIKKTIQDEALEKKWATKQECTLKAEALSFKLGNVLTSILVAAKLTIPNPSTNGRVWSDGNGKSNGKSSTLTR